MNMSLIWLGVIDPVVKGGQMTYNIGDVLDGRYKLVQQVGQGTYGTVWSAEQIKLKKKIAIKTLHERTGGISDLQKEAMIQATLDHRNIARIIDVNPDQRFIAMEYVEGESLERRLKKCIADGTWIEKDKAYELLVQCLEALTYAHQKSVVHGDIKPGNVMIRDDDVVKLTDFGVAKVISEEASTVYSIGAARKLGSVTYTAPEVLRGESRTPASDIFSLGIVGYLLFSGCHPFFNVHPSGLYSMREMLLSDEEAKRLREIDSSVPERYEKVIMKMIAKTPDSRYSEIKKAYEEFVAMHLVCTHCGENNRSSAHFCDSCGKSLEQARGDELKDKSAYELQHRAYQLNSLGHYGRAIEFCDEAIKMKPHFSAAYHTKGWAHSNLREYDEALECYKQALHLADDETQKANIYTNMAFVYMVKGERKKMIRHLEMAVKHDPNHPKANQLLQKYTWPENSYSFALKDKW